MHELTHIGLDVHKETIAVAVLRPGTSECDECVIANTPAALRKLLSRYPDRAALRTCYEAGPTGYDTHRLLSSLGVPCEVIAPSLIPRRSGVRVKTDRTDARNLARLHRAGELTPVRVPSPAEEALRDLVRTREDLKSDRRIARQRIRSFLLRYGRRCPAPGARWTSASRSGCAPSPSRSPPPRPPSTTWSAPTRSGTRSSRRSTSRSRRRPARRRSPSRWRACAPSAASTRCLR